VNIFVLSRNVRLCARFHCDQHVVKMPLETAQLLSTALWHSDAPAWSALHEQGFAYKPAHQGHPCALWTRECINNYLWLCALGLNLCDEYAYRFGTTAGDGETRQHRSRGVIAALRAAAPDLPRQRCVTSFAIVVPDECLLGDPVLSYRAYYLTYKAAFARWTRRAPPVWMIV
jgi:hypothetical protein